MCISICIAVLALVGTTDSSGTVVLPEGFEVGWSCLAGASGSGRWVAVHPVIDSTEIDAALTVTARSREIDFLACGAMSGDSTDTISFRRGRALVRWPGTPWIGAGVFLSDRQPFTSGLSNPLVEWGWQDIDSLYGYGMYCGGIMGFSGEYLIQRTSSDTLTQLNIESPWMGFAGLSYSRVHFHPADSLSGGGGVLNTLLIRSDFRYCRPWVVLAGAEGEPGRWAIAGQIRGYKPIKTRWGDMEIIPGMAFAGDYFSSPGSAFIAGQRQLSLGAYLNSARYMVSAGLTGVLDLDTDSLCRASARGLLISRTGIRWETECDVFADGDYRILLGAGMYRSEGGAGLILEMATDSTRITGTAIVAPRNDVNAEITVSADVDGSLDPLCRLDITTVMGPVSGLFGIVWEEDRDVSLIINLRGYFQ